MGVYMTIDLTPETLAKVAALAERNGRSVKEELAAIIEEHARHVSTEAGTAALTKTETIPRRPLLPVKEPAPAPEPKVKEPDPTYAARMAAFKAREASP